MAGNKQRMTKKRCKDCKKLFDPSDLSQRGLCMSCGYKRVKNCITQLQTRSGDYYDRWLAGLHKSLPKQKKGVASVKTS